MRGLTRFCTTWIALIYHARKENVILIMVVKSDFIFLVFGHFAKKKRTFFLWFEGSCFFFGKKKQLLNVIVKKKQDLHNLLSVIKVLKFRKTKKFCALVMVKSGILRKRKDLKLDFISALMKNTFKNVFQSPPWHSSVTSTDCKRLPGVNWIFRLWVTFNFRFIQTIFVLFFRKYFRSSHLPIAQVT